MVVFCAVVLQENGHLECRLFLYYMNFKHTGKYHKLDFQVNPVMILMVWIINIPIPPFPKRGCHFIQKFALGFVTEDVLPQTLTTGRFLLPQFLFVSGL